LIAKRVERPTAPTGDSCDRPDRNVRATGTVSSARTALAVADVTLLFEAGSEASFDVIVLAACRPDPQLARVISRDGLAEAEARERIAAQWPLDQKRARPDYVIDTSGIQTETETQTKNIVRTIAGS